MFQDEARGSRVEGPHRVDDVRVHREEDDLRLGARLPELQCCLDAVEQRHGNVRHDDVRTQLFHRGQQGATVLDTSDHLELRLEKSAQTIGDDLVIVCEQNSSAGHAMASGRGTRTKMPVPLPGSARIVRSP